MDKLIIDNQLTQDISLKNDYNTVLNYIIEKYKILLNDRPWDIEKL